MGGGVSRVQSITQPETIVADRVMETLSPRIGGKGSQQNQKIREIQVRNHGLNDSTMKSEIPTTTTIQKEEIKITEHSDSSSGMKYIFSSIQSFPGYLSSHQRHLRNTNQQPMIPNPQTNTADNKTNDVNDHVAHFTLNRNPFDSIKLSLLSKPLNGKTIIMQNKSKNKYKNVRTIAVTSPRDQK